MYDLVTQVLGDQVIHLFPNGILVNELSLVKNKNGIAIN